jgi:hypothetical protein
LTAAGDGGERLSASPAVQIASIVDPRYVD